MFNKLFHYQPNFEIKWRIVLPVILLCCISLLLLKSTSQNQEFIGSTLFKQFVWIGVGVLVFYLVQVVKTQVFYEYAYILFGLLIIALLVTYFMPVISGASRWIILGPIRFQPSEMGKLIVIFALAKFLSDQHEHINPKKVIPITLGIAVLPAIIVFRQPDLGTAIIYFAVVIPMLYWAGIRPYHLFIVFAPVVSILAAFNLLSFYIWMAIVIVVLFTSQPKLLIGVGNFLINIAFGTLSTLIWNKLYTHQQERILTFFDPFRDPRGAGYQIIQSITAIGSGGIFGKGYGQGTQTHLRFLPVRDTDFIISVAGEEFGLFGILFILILFFVLIYCLIVYARRVHNRFASLSIIGFTAILFVHTIVNIGMVVGLVPVTGLPVPFISYGGSFLLSAVVTIAISNNIINYDI
ncbi:MAG: rod shape-determining protein RodA [Candidatus Marinimicrobia bacterium]|nr:rod shape-determining protein RodA [Candidatus Neomarinimicrobiota bacterium]MBL7023110.1 rod shape-determining protein RodA [Candidatus Neomarinimicrobiota bacterium]MBL7109130.1 rod shape-determining protein RodA [Candidatus Neomarinimicrobiota bacterium]